MHGYFPEDVTAGRFAIPKEAVPALLARAETEAQPANSETLAQALNLIAVLPSRAMDDTTGKIAIMAYRIGLDDVPGDLLETAVRHALKSCHFRPTPAELREFVKDEMRARSLRLHRLRALVKNDA